MLTPSLLRRQPRGACRLCLDKVGRPLCCGFLRNLADADVASLERLSDDSCSFKKVFMEKVLIVAIADNNAIGRNNELLWHISEDLKFFKRTTMGCPVIMGRKTFESIGRPLPKRLNVVVTRRGFDAPEGVIVVGSLEEAYEYVERTVSDVRADAASSDIQTAVSGFDRQNEPAVQRLFIMGGGQIYAQALPDMDRLIITHVHTVIDDADTFFPKIDPAVWKVAKRSEKMTDPETAYAFEFVEYVRV